MDEVLSSNADPSPMLSKRARKSEPNITQTTLFQKKKSKELDHILENLDHSKSLDQLSIEKRNIFYFMFDNPEAWISPIKSIGDHDLGIAIKDQRVYKLFGLNSMIQR